MSAASNELKDMTDQFFAVSQENAQLRDALANVSVALLALVPCDKQREAKLIVEQLSQ